MNCAYSSSRCATSRDRKSRCAWLRWVKKVVANEAGSTYYRARDGSSDCGDNSGIHSCLSYAPSAAGLATRSLQKIHDVRPVDQATFATVLLDIFQPPRTFHLATSLAVTSRCVRSTRRPKGQNICSRSFEKIISSSQESATRVFFANRGSLSR